MDCLLQFWTKRKRSIFLRVQIVFIVELELSLELPDSSLPVSFNAARWPRARARQSHFLESGPIPNLFQYIRRNDDCVSLGESSSASAPREGRTQRCGNYATWQTQQSSLYGVYFRPLVHPKNITDISGLPCFFVSTLTKPIYFASS